MRTTIACSLFTGFVITAGLMPLTGFAQSLSSSLGAGQLDGLEPFAECLERVKGHREQLIATRLDAKLAISTALNAEERAAWQRDIAALRAVTPQQPNFVPPDAKDEVHYLLGLTDAEQVSINSMTSRFSQEINLECEQKYGGMTRYSPTSDQSGQKAYEEQLRADMATPIEIATIAVTALPSPFPKSKEQMAVPIDPQNPMRAMMRLTPEQQAAAATEYGQKVAQQMTACLAR